MCHLNTSYTRLLWQAQSTLNTNSSSFSSCNLEASQVFCRLRCKMTEFTIHSLTTILTLVKVLGSNTPQNSLLKQFIT